MNPSSYGDLDNRRAGGVWNALNRFMIGAIIVALCVVGTLAFAPIFKQHSEESTRIEQLQAAISKKQVLLARQTKEAELLKNDPAYLETIARDRLDMMKPGETIIRLEPARSPAPASPGQAKN